MRSEGKKDPWSRKFSIYSVSPDGICHIEQIPKAQFLVFQGIFGKFIKILPLGDCLNLTLVMYKKKSIQIDISTHDMELFYVLLTTNGRITCIAIICKFNLFTDFYFITMKVNIK